MLVFKRISKNLPFLLIDNKFNYNYNSVKCFEGGLNLLDKIGVKIFVNSLTVFRCVFTFAMPFLMKKISDMAFLIIIGVLFFTDCLDGFISRKCHAQTLFGSIMDTIADKVLCIVLILCISSEATILYIILIGELIIALMNTIGTINDASIKASMMGKAKMWALAIETLLGYMYYFEICGILLLNIVGAIVALMQVFVIFTYGNKMRKVKHIRNKKFEFKKGKDLVYALFDTNYYLSTIDLPITKKLTIN